MNLWILLPTAVGLIAGLIGYLTKRSIDAIDQKIITTNTRIAEINSKLDISNSNFDKAIDELRHEFYEYKDKVNDEFVKKTDYVMSFSDISRKMDKVYDILMDLNKRINK